MCKCIAQQLSVETTKRKEKTKKTHGMMIHLKQKKKTNLYYL